MEGGAELKWGTYLLAARRTERQAGMRGLLRAQLPICFLKRNPDNYLSKAKTNSLAHSRSCPNNITVPNHNSQGVSDSKWTILYFVFDFNSFIRHFSMPSYLLFSTKYSNPAIIQDPPHTLSSSNRRLCALCGLAGGGCRFFGDYCGSCRFCGSRNRFLGRTGGNCGQLFLRRGNRSSCESKHGSLKVVINC